MEDEIMELEQKILGVLKTIYDPEIPVNIYELGLIYEIDVDDYMNVDVKMTLTAPNCPVADNLVNEVNGKIAQIDEAGRVTVELVFDPPWDETRMSDVAMLELGLL